MLELIILGATIIILNVLDSVTTHIAFRQYPDKKLRAESNPFMRKIMVKSPLKASLIKHTAVLFIVIYLIICSDWLMLRVIGSILGLVVLNNSYIVIRRAIAKRKTTTPMKLLLHKLHIPKKFTRKYGYVLIVFIILSIALLGNYLAITI